MHITLDQVVPYPLGGRIDDSPVWGKGISFESNAFIELTAPSARGKTTLIAIIYGLRSDYSGDVRFDGVDIRIHSHREWALIRTTRLSIVFQDLRLFDDRTGMENILVKACLTGTPDESAIREIADRMELAGAIDKTVAELSWGEKQRVALIRALIQPADFILLDEPFSHLNSNLAKKCAGFIIDQCERMKTGIICTTLDPSSIFPFTTRITV